MFSELTPHFTGSFSFVIYTSVRRHSTVTMQETPGITLFCRQPLPGISLRWYVDYIPREVISWLYFSISKFNSNTSPLLRTRPHIFFLLVGTIPVQITHSKKTPALTNRKLVLISPQSAALRNTTNPYSHTESLKQNRQQMFPPQLPYQWHPPVPRHVARHAYNTLHLSWHPQRVGPEAELAQCIDRVRTVIFLFIIE